MIAAIDEYDPAAGFEGEAGAPKWPTSTMSAQSTTGEGTVGVEFDLTFSDGTADEPSDDSAESATSLYRWLVAEPGLRGHAEVSTGSQPSAQGHMGDTLATVNIVLTNSIALGTLITAVVSWRGSRQRPPQVRLERDGVVVTLHDSSPESVAQILRVWNESTGPAPTATDGSGPAPTPADGDIE